MDSFESPQAAANTYRSFGDQQTITTKSSQFLSKRASRLARRRKTRTNLRLNIGNRSSSNVASPPTNTKTATSTRSRKHKRYSRRRQQAPGASPEPPGHTQPSFLECMTQHQLDRALSYYYDHPEYLPYRQSGAFHRARSPMPEVLVLFDEDIFARAVRLRPIPDESLDEIDPFMLDTS